MIIRSCFQFCAKVCRKIYGFLQTSQPAEQVYIYIYIYILHFQATGAGVTSFTLLPSRMTCAQLPPRACLRSLEKRKIINPYSTGQRLLVLWKPKQCLTSNAITRTNFFLVYPPFSPLALKVSSLILNAPRSLLEGWPPTTSGLQKLLKSA